jgi:hypothetical protein
MDNELWDDEVNDLNNFDNKIHIHSLKIKNKNTTVINGLIFNNKDENKQFISHNKKKFGIAGYQTIVEKINEKDMVFVFSGDYRTKIKNVLVETYNKSEENIEIH